MEQELFQKAQESINDPDLIVNMYDHSIVWASEVCVKLTGKKTTEIIGKSAYDFEDLPLDKAQLNTKETIVSLEGEKEYPIKTSKGTFLTKFIFKIFEYNSIHYFVGKIASITPQK